MIGGEAQRFITRPTLRPVRLFRRRKKRDCRWRFESFEHISLQSSRLLNSVFPLQSIDIFSFSRIQFDTSHHHGLSEE